MIEKKRIVAWILTIMMVFQMLPTSALGEGDWLSAQSNTDEGVNTYTVQFLAKDGTKLVEQLVQENCAAVEPDIPDVQDFKFVSWTSDLEGSTVENVTGNTNFTATYQALTKLSVTVNYRYTDGVTMKQSDVYEFNAGDDVALDIQAPTQSGFTYTAPTGLTEDADVENLYHLNITGIAQDYEYTFVYSGEKVTYQVNHKWQNVNDNNYTTHETETLTSEIGRYTNAQAKTYEGFTALSFTQKMLAAGDTIEIDIYYDRNTYVVTYDSKGGTFVDTAELRFGANVPLTRITKLGATFKGWTLDPDGEKTVLSELTMPDHAVMLTALWDANNEADYTINYWLTNLDKTDEYDFVKSVTKSGTVGTKPNNISIRTSELSGVDSKYDTFFEFNAKKSTDITTTGTRTATAVNEITADGKTVYNVYFNRKTVTFNFYKKKSIGSNDKPDIVLSGLYGQTFAQAGKGKTNAASYKWPAPESGKMWRASIFSAGITYLNGFIQTSLNGTTVNFYYMDADDKTVIQYIENLTPNTYTAADTFDSSTGGLQISEKFQPGFYYYGYKTSKNGSIKKDKSVGDTINNASYIEIYNKRNSFELSFANCAPKPAVTYKFEQVLSEPTTPSQPAGVDSDYTFGGWYKDPAFQYPVTWDNGNKTADAGEDTMPAAKMVVYAKWDAPTFTVTYNFNDGETVNHVDKVVKKETAPDYPETPDRSDEGLVFDGWYVDDGTFTKPFVKNTTVTHDWKVIAKWVSSDGPHYTVRYVDEEGNDLTSLIENPNTGDYGELNESITLDAPVIPGYEARQPSITFTLTDGYVVTFVYVKLESWTLNIQYVNKEKTPTDEGYFLLPTETQVITESKVIRFYKQIDGYKLESATFVSVEKPANGTSATITFEYVPVTPKQYVVEFYVQDAATGEYPEQPTYTDNTRTEKLGQVVYVTGDDKSRCENDTHMFDADNALNVLSGTVTTPVVEKDEEGNDVVTNRLTLKLYFCLKTSTVTYVYEGHVPQGAPALPEKKTYNINSQQTVESNPTMNGYTFSGWKSDDVTVDRAGNYTVPSKPVTFKGSWTIRNDLSYSVEYRWNGSPIAQAKSVGSQTYNQIVYESPIDVDGYTPVTNNEKSITIGTGENVIIFDYYKNVTLTANSYSRTYDGQEVTVGTSEDDIGYTCNVSGLQFDGIATSGTGQDAGKYEVNFREVAGPESSPSPDGIIVEKNLYPVDSTGLYIVTSTNTGTLTINPRKLELTSGSASQEYNGIALTKNEVNVTTGSFVEGEGADYTVTGSQLDVGTSKNSFVYTLKANTKSDNYQISVVYGDLTVTKNTATIVITAASDSKTYDGKPLNKNSYTYTGAVATGDVLSAVVSGSITNAGTGQNKVTSYTVTRDGKSVTGNYTFGDSVDGKLIVRKREMALTSGNASKVYDGKALQNTTVYVEGDGFAEGEGATYSEFASLVDVGTSTNSFTYKLNEGTSADNYNIQTKYGELEVTPITRQIVITAASDSKTYDGKPLNKNSFTYEGALVEGDVLSAVVSGSITNAGTEQNKVTSYTVTRDGKSVTGNYTFGDSVDGELIVRKRQVTLTSATDSKVYDEGVLENHEVTVGGELFVTGEGATYTNFASRVYIGTSDNTFSYALNDDTNPDNYDITQNYGLLIIRGGSEVNPLLVVTKTHESKSYNLNEVVTFNITVTNIYDEQKTIVVTEQEGVTITGPATFKDVQPGGSATTTASYTIQEADILAGRFDNTVTASFAGETDTYSAQDTVITAVPHAVLTKSKVTLGRIANGAGDQVAYEKPSKGYALGDVIYYEITVKNEGNVTVSGIVVTDELTQFTSEPFDLAPQASATFTTSYTVTSNDILKGSVKNVATVSGGTTPEPSTSPDPIETPSPSPTVPDTDDETEEVNAKLNVEKTTLNNTKAYGIGDTIEYQIVVTNAGNVPYYSVTVSDPLTNLTNTIPVLAVGETATYTCSYTVTKNDILGGYVLNVATAQADPIQKPDGDTVIPSGRDDTEDVTEPMEGKLSKKKETLGIRVANDDGSVVYSKPTTGYKLGDEIWYQITVTNEGNVDYTNVVVDDAMTKASWTIATIEVGESVVLLTSHKVTSDDILAGVITNYASVTGTTPVPKDTPAPTSTTSPTPVPTPTPTDSPEPDTTDYPERVNAELNVEKTTLNNTKAYGIGDKIEYQIVVTNAGNVPYYSVTVEDELVEKSWDIGTLEVGASKTITLSYEVTKDDIVNGFVLNVATAKADPIELPQGGAITPEGSDSTEDVTEAMQGRLSKEKVTLGIATVENGRTTYAPSTSYKLGDKIWYQITVANVGNVDYTNVVVDDALTGDSWTIDTLEVGETVVYLTSYVVTSDDILEGVITNYASVTGETPAPNSPDPTSTTRPTPVPTPTPVDSPSPDTTDKPEDIIRKLDVTKTAPSLSAGQAVEIDELINYEITVHNGGNVPYYNVVVDDRLDGAVIVANANYSINVNGDAVIAKLEVGESATVYAQYTVTAADLAKSQVVNIAVATADDPKPADPEKPDKPKGEATDERDTKNPELSIVKTALVTGSYVQPDDEFAYEITVSNKGEGKATNVVVVDALPKQVDYTGHSGDGKVDVADNTVTWTIDTIAAGASITLKINVKVKSQDELEELDTTITNTATIVNQPVNPPKPEDEPKGEEETKIAMLEVEKTAAVFADGELKPADGDALAAADLNDVIRYTVTVRNIGAVELKNVEVHDDMIARSENLVIPADAKVVNAENGETYIVINTLAVNTQAVITYEYTVTEDDVYEGNVFNKVSVATDEKSFGSDETETKTKDPKLNLVTEKSVLNPKESFKIGDTIEYQLVVTNTGNVTAYSVVVTDTLVSDANPNGLVQTFTIDSIAPGASETIKYNYTVQAADLLPAYNPDGTERVHTIHNAAGATGEDRTGEKYPGEETDTDVEVKQYVLVRFFDSITGGLIKEAYVPYGGSTTAPEVPEHAGFSFVGWIGGIWTNVYSNQIIWASYDRLEGNLNTTILDAEIPLAGGYISNVGECFD